LTKISALKYLKKTIWFLFSALFFAAALLFDIRDHTAKINPSIHQKIQVEFSRQTAELEKQLENAIAKTKKPTADKTGFLFHIYINNDLVSWNTTQMPTETYLTSPKPKQGIYKLKNGHYYICSKVKGDTIIQGSILIQSDYQIENEYLENTFNTSIYNGPATIVVSKTGSYSIKDNKGKHIFYIKNNPNPNSFAANSNITFVLLVLSCVFLLFGLYFLTRNNPIYSVFSLIILIAIRVFVLYYLPTDIFHNQEYQSANLFALNGLFPNILSLLVNTSVIIYGSFILFNLGTQIKNRLSSYLLLLFLYYMWWLIIDLLEIVVQNSSISLTLDLPFTLSVYSYTIVVLFAVIFYSYYYLLFKASSKFIETNPSKIVQGSFVLSIAFIYLLVGGQFNDKTTLTLLIPTILVCISFITQGTSTGGNKIIIQLLILALFSTAFVKELTIHNEKKEKSIRALYASQLLADRDEEAELKYTTVQNQIISDSTVRNYFKSLEITPTPAKVSDFFEQKYFTGTWDAYALSVAILDTSNNTIIAKDGLDHIRIKDLLENHGQESDINPSIFFIKDAYLGYNYIIKQVIPGNLGTLFLFFKSKKIPEEIGFPRLLLSKEANVLREIGHYSIAKYYAGKLVTKRGAFDFQKSISFYKKPPGKSVFFDQGGYNHYILYKGNNRAVILSEKIKTNYDVLTSFSYVFCFWGLLLVVLNTAYIFIKKGRSTWTLALKIQLMSVSLVTLSLIFFGAVSGLFVSRQYESFNNKTITEKVKSIEIELINKIYFRNALTKSEDAAFFETLTAKLATVFDTDINIYDLKGQLLGGSKPKVISLGLQSEQINPQAFQQLINKSGIYSQKETIGKLSFQSVYVPIINGSNQILGYLNIQHFNKQEDYEKQIQSFLVSIMSIFILLLAGAIIISLLASTRLVHPLKQLQQKVKSISFGQQNQQIVYTAKDEISTIVDAYNSKLIELEEAINLLKSNERESAWREMAKQVAHEINNPLTPIKLSVQQLLRVYDPSDPDSKKKLEIVVKSIIEQIDALVKIAKAFSSFAQLPEPKKEQADLVQIISNVLLMFSSYKKASITFDAVLDTCFLSIDKEQWIQVLNNIIKNSIQACANRPDSQIHLRLYNQDQTIIISVQDNGRGIPEDQKEKIFQPHFTTKSKGSGIGLSIVKQIVENHGGQIFFESSSNLGTKFTIVLPTIS
jgi:two-component system, NtrC family, nitrogen regulation sensor histidine kinase NtrY